MSQSGPKRIIDLDSKPQSFWKLDPKAVHAWQGKLWGWQKIGCILCMTEEDSNVHGQTLRDQDGNCLCLTHGELEPITYRVTRKYSINIGSDTKSGTLDKNTVILFPKNITGPERNEAIIDLIDECVDLEAEGFEDDEHSID